MSDWGAPMCQDRDAGIKRQEGRGTMLLLVPTYSVVFSLLGRCSVSTGLSGQLLSFTTPHSFITHDPALHSTCD